MVENDGQRGGDGNATKKRTLRVTLARSVAGRLSKHQACVSGLGLRRIGHTVEVEDTPAVRGMIHRAGHLLSIVGE